MYTKKHKCVCILYVAPVYKKIVVNWLFRFEWMCFKMEFGL